MGWLLKQFFTVAFRDILLRRNEKFLSVYVVTPGYSIPAHRKVSKCLYSDSGIFYCGALRDILLRRTEKFPSVI